MLHFTNMENLVIVESPSKTKKLAGFLGKDYNVLSSVGHVRDLPKSGLGVDVENDFEPEYIISPDKKDIVSKLKKAAKTADAIYLATDLDREGEAIAWHVACLMNGDKNLKPAGAKDMFDIADKIKNKKGESPKVYRVTFNSITKDDVLGAFDSPRKLDIDLINAQQGRRILDRLVGYRLSPLLWEKIRYGLSAGRVQSVAVRLIVEREREIEKFIKSPYFEIETELKPQAKPAASALKSSSSSFICKLVSINNKNISVKKKFDFFAGSYTASSTTISTEKEAKSIEKDLSKSQFYIKDVISKDIKSHPSPPFSTSTLQQSAASNLGYAPKRTMQLAQKLYESGHITYMRTDSSYINPDFVESSRKYIKKIFGEKYLVPHERYFKGKKNLRTQEAHEAIRPTDVNIREDGLAKSLTPQHKKLYDLIWRRTVATQMSYAVFESTKVIVSTKDDKYLFEANGSVVKFDGYLKVYSNKKKDDFLPKLEKGSDLNLLNVNLNAKEMSPPPRYNEASLVKELESFNIGRPSTYASIISTIQARGYVKKIEKSLSPTDNGLVVNDLLVRHFPQIVDVDFTADVEESLDLVALGELDWKKLVKDFYIPFAKLVDYKKKEIKKEDVVVMEKTDEVCPECKKANLIIKLGKYGKFLSCSNYPECKYARPIESTNSSDVDEDGNAIVVDIPELKNSCPECKGKLLVKEGRFGKFIACENYPKCKYTKPILNKIGMKCPDCGKEHDGEVVIKRTKKGRSFYGCSRYPQCKYTSWKKPEGDGGSDSHSTPGVKGL
ncbi:type I DNA topoisomerase [candidate division WWE3 bacterium CG_4_9_14_3_um_filter_34_6]|uniref:DNA topoisomerase 1 n=1 Tax=candidate division WWE3 bacterium CG_4_9_14_3_um_filter_34_6 TaxID=1975079 RepID=A0A2M7X3K1_UNCKA|nr:MAG: type I DNA topoisomerase [candidate division WWE3 bacterium CG_4_9_14_3_um_filter_34_6]